MAAFTPCISLVAPEGEYHVDGGPVCSENALRFWVDFLCKYLESLQYNSSKDLSDNAKEGDVAIIITMAPDTVSLFAVLPCCTPRSGQCHNQCYGSSCELDAG